MLVDLVRVQVQGTVPALTGGEQWSEGPDGGQLLFDAALARVVVLVLLVSAVCLGLGSVLVPGGQIAHPGSVLLLDLVAAVAAGAVAAVQILPYRVCVAVTCAGSALIALAQVAAGPGAPAAAFASLYGLCLAAAFLFYGPGVLACQIIWACAAQGAALVWLGDARAAAVQIGLSVGSATASGIVARRFAMLQLDTRRHLAWQATHDVLTGLVNRAGLAQAVQAYGAGARLSLLVIDLRGFKQINDSFGHSAGDAVLVQVSSRLASQGTPTAVAARLGGDEFALLLPGADAAQAMALAGSMRAAISRPIQWGSLTLQVEATIGAATGVLAPDHDLSSLLSAGDLAMYAARQRGQKIAHADHIREHSRQ